MAKHLLSNAQHEQMESMCKEGKSSAEILAFFKSQYQLDVPAYIVYSIKTKLNKVAGGAKTGRKYHRKALGGGTTDPSTDNINKLVEQLRAELEAYSKYVIGKIRIELVKAIGEARKKRIDAGEDVEEFKAPEVEEL